MMRAKVLGLAVAVAGGLGIATAANAAPTSVGPIQSRELIETVAGGCGPGWHPNRFGDCRPNDRGPGYGYGGPRGYYGDRPVYRGDGYGYGRGGYGYGRGGYDRPRRFYDGY